MLMFGHHALCVVGVGACGVGCRWMDTLSGSRSTPVGCVCLVLLGCVWLAVLAAVVVVGVVWWVVCDLYSGCEHLVLFCGFV